MHHHSLILRWQHTLRLHQSSLVRIDHSHHHVGVSSHHEHLLLLGRIDESLSLRVDHHIWHLVLIHSHLWSHRHGQLVAKLLLLVLLGLHTRVCSQLLVTVCKAASFLIRTSSLAIKELAFNSLVIRATLLYLRIWALIKVLLSLALIVVIEGLTLLLVHRSILLCSNSILHLSFTQRLVLGTHLLLTMSELAFVSNLALAKVLKMSAQLGLISEV